MTDHFLLKNVSVYFNVYKTVKDKSIKNTIINRIGGNIFKKNKHEFVRALDDISISIKSGDRIGLVGPNGSGKSTFLKLLAGCIEPLEGKIIRNGKINSILSLGMGLDSELTGTENIKLQGHFRNYTKSKRQDFIDKVISFSELENFINMPVESYSSGMTLRLAFAIATYEIPEILLLDEIINVGDKDFAEKSKRKIEALIKTSQVLILASHNEGVIKNYCNTIFQFDKGSLKVKKI